MCATRLPRSSRAKSRGVCSDSVPAPPRLRSGRAEVWSSINSTRLGRKPASVLPAPGRCHQQRIAPRAGGDEHFELVPARRPALGGEPVGNDRRQRAGLAGRCGTIRLGDRGCRPHIASYGAPRFLDRAFSGRHLCGAGRRLGRSLAAEAARIGDARPCRSRPRRPWNGVGDARDSGDHGMPLWPAVGRRRRLWRGDAARRGRGDVRARRPCAGIGADRARI